MTRSIDRNEVRAKASAGDAILVEALPAKYFLQGHLPGARHMPHDRVRTLAPSVVPDKQAEIIVYCASDACRNSHIAAQTLAALGYTNVAVYAGGKREWVEAGLALEMGGSAAEAA